MLVAAPLYPLSVLRVSPHLVHHDGRSDQLCIPVDPIMIGKREEAGKQSILVLGATALGCGEFRNHTGSALTLREPQNN